MTFFLSVLILVVIAAVLYSKSKKTSAIPAEQRQPDASKGKTVTGPDGKTYVVPRSLGKAEKMAKEATEGSVYQLMCARQAADIGYEMFQKNDLIGDPENDMMDADVFFEQCFNAALFCQRGREGSYAPDPSKSVHYYEIFVEVAMAMADKNWFKAHDLHMLFTPGKTWLTPTPAEKAALSRWRRPRNILKMPLHQRPTPLTAWIR